MRRIGTTFLLLCSLTAFVAWALPAGATRVAKTVTITAGKPSEFKYTLSAKTVPLGTVTFKFIDKGALPHDVRICTSNKGGLANSCAGKSTTTISPGASTSINVTFKKAGTYEYVCTLPGHAAAGMKGDLKVT
jgi:nitrite reductase (NO-forming)